MKGGSFSLEPFPAGRPRPQMNLTCSLGRRTDALSLSYLLLCHPGEVIVPAPADVPSRRYALWEETCFEFFIGTRDSDKYWEFNLSPAGNWNVYFFRSYRQGMQEEQAFTSLPFSVSPRPDGLRLSLEIDLGKIFPEGQAIRIAVSAVINTMDDGQTYWALVHPGSQPDFHRRESFVVEL